MKGRVAGKCALVTGAAQGLGAAQARLLAAEGARVLITDLNEAGAKAVADEINAAQGRGSAFALRHDVTSEADWRTAIDAAREQLGGLSILVNNAGIGAGGNIENCSFADWKRSFAVNVDSAFLGTQNALPLMKEHQPGSIVNISSIAGLIASDAMPAYNASKAAIWMLTKSVALYCAKQKWNIRCNSVHPTFVDTPILDGIGARAGLEKEVVMGKLARQIPLGRIGRPEEVAQGVLYLASDESSFMTGAELKLDGGISAM
ncbi:SDR family oxidoreductase [Porphyrobacter sp. GA68]|uniref:SDR family oxidoreductase n=1 Tax=Porphyrobacter sp. GA68 TaxID=2883480 RepID=UPI001D181BFC|nr:SDR family oxidoreductase [Porphyrobacter sp. GA68]